jgi:DNA-binding transcriptional LysR family regulator
MNLTIRQLEIFIELAKNPHLGKVAQEIGLTQSAVSMAIRTLEDVLEKKLFDRINKKLVLNEYGRLFLQQIEPPVRQLIDTEKRVREDHHIGEIKIGASSSIANYLIPHIIYRFKEQYPGAVIRLESGNTKDVIHLVENGQVDIGFVEGEFDSIDVKYEILGDDELYVVTGDPEMDCRREYGIEELMEKKWILREKGSGTREVFLNYLGDHKKRLNVFMELNHAGGVKAILNNKDTLACLSQYCLRKELINGLLRRLQIKHIRFTRSFFIVWHRRKILSPILTEFVQMAKEYKREDRSTFLRF